MIQHPTQTVHPHPIPLCTFLSFPPLPSHSIPSSPSKPQPQTHSTVIQVSQWHSVRWCFTGSISKSTFKKTRISIIWKQQNCVFTASPTQIVPLLSSHLKTETYPSERAIRLRFLDQLHHSMNLWNVRFIRWVSPAFGSKIKRFQDRVTINNEAWWNYWNHWFKELSFQLRSSNLV